MGSHAQKPSPEQRCPVRIITGNAVSQFQNPVFTIPARQVVQEILHRMIDRHMVGIQITDDIPVPHFHSFTHGVHRNTRQYPLVYRAKIEVETMPFAIFHLRGQRIVSEFITTLHKFIHLHGEKLFGRQTALLSESFGGPVYTFHRFANQQLVRREPVMRLRPPHGIFFGNTRPEAMLRQTHQQRLYIVSLPISVQFLKRSVECSGEKHRQRFIVLISGRHSLQRRIGFPRSPDESRFGGKADGLFHINGHRFRIEIKFGIVRQPTILFEQRFFQFNIKRQLRLIIFHGRLISMRMKKLYLLA